MPAQLGPRLSQALERFSRARSAPALRELGLRFGLQADRLLPVVFQLDPEPVAEGEAWARVRKRIAARLSTVQNQLEALGQDRGRHLLAGCSLAAMVDAEILPRLQEIEGGCWLELSLAQPAFAMDDAGLDLGLPLLLARHPDLDGSGVRVAVLDSGIDNRHPALKVAEAVSTCLEDISIPGHHGTLCAGIVASRDEVVRGVAPGIELIDIKVGSSRTQKVLPTDGLAGFDQALHRGAHVLLASWGFNHFRHTVDGGHGWSCPDGRCPLCTAVETASQAGLVVVTAAGNEHQLAETLRHFGESFDTELVCPAQARSALAVGAIKKHTFEPSPRSSHGPSAYGTQKPDLAAPGVNIRSTAVLPAELAGSPESLPDQLRFDRASGTSFAAPMVAGTAALLIQRRRREGVRWTSEEIRRQLIEEAVLSGGEPMIFGAGRLDLSRL